jgi:hypothetical protein
MSSTQQLLLGEGAGGVIPAYIEEVFASWLYAGNSSTQTITNGIDLSTKGGLVWSKYRTSSFIHNLFDTARGVQKTLCTNNTDAQATETGGITAFNSDGYTTGSWSQINSSSGNFISWTFREQPKFFDVVTYSGTSSNQTISHNLGSVPGCIMIKTLNAADDWMVYHRSTTATQYLSLNQTIAAQTLNSFMNNTEPTSTVFTVGTTGGVNNPGTTYVAYLFAHNAGGFGLTGTDNVISCGSFTTSGGAATVTLGYEPQWLMVKRTDSTGDWAIYDSLLGIPTGSDKRVLYPNTSGPEVNGNNPFDVSATGFNVTNASAFPGGANTSTYIYVTIRRGPMKIPTVGTSVFTPTVYSGNGTYNRNIDTTITPDSIWNLVRNASGPDRTEFDSLRGWPYYSLYLNLNYSEAFTGADILARPTIMNSIRIASSGTNYLNNGSYTYANYSFKRAPNFYDVVCYTGTGSNRNVSHSLGVAPEFMIIKRRNGNASWAVYSATLGATKRLFLNSNSPQDTEPTYFNSTSPTASVFTVGTDSAVNGSGSTYVAYLFATLAGVSKVGSYTGTGSTQTINCGFTTGARFVLIKRTNDTGDWYVWDTARGMVSGTDPFSRLNENQSENNTNTVFTTSVGFQVATTEAELNASGSTFIFLAIA